MPAYPVPFTPFPIPDHLVLLDRLSGSHVVRVEGVAAYSRSGEGMHRFHDPVDGETYLYT